MCYFIDYHVWNMIRFLFNLTISLDGTAVIVSKTKVKTKKNLPIVLFLFPHQETPMSFAIALYPGAPNDTR